MTTADYLATIIFLKVKNVIIVKYILNVEHPIYIIAVKSKKIKLLQNVHWPQMTFITRKRSEAERYWQWLQINPHG